MKKMITRRNFLKAAGVSAAALGLAACGGSSSSTASSAASSTAASSTAAKADGKVYYLNFKPEQDQDWQDLAAEYTKETGVPVTVVTAASGQYETTLMSEMEKSEAPTLFQVNGPVGLANWKDYCYDLSGSQLYGELTSDSFALKDGDAVTSIAYVIETYGIIYNKELLSAAGYTQDDIKGFADLKKVADDIQARKAELGVDGAFTSAGMGGIGAGIYAFLNRLLIPTGLHHALNNVFWFDTIGLGDLSHFWAGETSADVGWSLGMYMSGLIEMPCSEKKCR